MPFLLVASCDNDDDDGEINGTLEVVAGLNVTVRDAVTNGLLSTGVTVTAQDGSYTETLEQFPNDEAAVFLELGSVSERMW